MIKNIFALRTWLIGASLCFSVGTAPVLADKIPDNIAKAVANEMRLADNSARDADRKPAEVLAFYNVKPGQSVLDLYASGGYFTELFSGSVGPEGKVYAFYRPGQRYDDSKDKLAAHYAGFGNITMLASAPEHIDLPDNSVDMVMLSLILHHLHYDAATPDVLPDSSKALFAEIRRVLKPGGTFAVLEHAAIAGASRQRAAEWHRIDPAMAKADLTSVGFEFIGASDVHTNPDDDRQNMWGQTGLRGKTTRLVHAYRSPD